MGNDERHPESEGTMTVDPAVLAELHAIVLFNKTLQAVGAPVHDEILWLLLPETRGSGKDYALLGKAVAFAHGQVSRGVSASGYDVNVFRGFLERVRAGESVARYIPDMDLWGRWL